MIVFRGVSNAHKQIVKFAKDSQLKEICIGEDDMKFLGKGAFEYYISNKQTDYDLYLGNIFSGTLREDNTVENFAGLTLYFIHERFYDTFLSTDELQHLDRAMEGHRGKYVVCNPMVTTQQEGFSDNKKEWGKYDEYLQDYKLFGR